MNWTKEIPTVDGWYWIRITDDPDAGVWAELVKDKCLYDKIYNNWCLVNKRDCYEFYGPLEEPK